MEAAVNKNPQMIFVSLPVTDLARSKAFYESLGFANNPKFTDDTAACMVLSETILVMLLTHAKWATFTTRPITDPRKAAQVLLGISRSSKGAVDSIVETAQKQGGASDPTQPQNLGFMYSRSFEDPDGHIWETTWMNPEAAF
jgi:uncharacterized protein